MEVRCDNPQIKAESEVCPCCQGVLEKEVRSGSYLIKKCSNCRNNDRDYPWGNTGGTWWAERSFSDETCSCTYGEKDFLYISCENCKSPKCIKCKTPLRCCNKRCGFEMCPPCISTAEFKHAWKTSSPQEKLNLYGTEKLKILAKKKGLRGYSKYKKNELVQTLAPLVSESDFPIKSI